MKTQTDYEVTVTATDNGTPTMESATITVTINVRNVSVANGDTAVANREPVFNDGPSTTREVDENTAAKANIGNPVAAMDVDRGDTLTYGLLSGGDADSFDIDTGSGQLKTKAPLNYEEVDPPKTSYMVTVTVSDGKNADGTAAPDDEVDDTIRVTIMVTDVNEAPAFADGTPTRMVDENTAADVNIGDPVVATDVDSGDTADTLTYTLGGTDAASFDIESTTTGGQLKTKAALDRETQTDYEVTVIATDKAGLTGEITVTITVEDVSVEPMATQQ